jgi:hypothetical protein
VCATHRGFVSSERERRDAKEAVDREQARERQATLAAHVRGLPKWEYQVKRVGEDKQKGLLGSQRMEQLFNGEGASGGCGLSAGVLAAGPVSHLRRSGVRERLRLVPDPQPLADSCDETGHRMTVRR